MSDQHAPISITQVPEPPRRSGLPTWFLIAIVGVAVLGVILIAVVLAVTLGGDDDKDSDAAKDPDSDEPETFIVHGEMELYDYTGDNILRYQGTCSGYEGYDDMVAGAQVVIRDATGETVAVSALDEGEPQGRTSCIFPFTVEDVPAGESIYSVEVSHRGEITFKEDEAEVGLTLSLGG